MAASAPVLSMTNIIIIAAGGGGLIIIGVIVIIVFVTVKKRREKQALMDSVLNKPPGGVCDHVNDFYFQANADFIHFTCEINEICIGLEIEIFTFLDGR